MATFLTTDRIVDHLYRIIGEATEEIVLVSAYIKLDDVTKKRLNNKIKRNKIDIHMVYGKRKSQISLDDRDFLDSHGIKVTFVKNLHAKCYLNENEVLLTSMNFHQFSQENNDEMGILVSRADDPELYEAIYRETNRLKSGSSKPSTKNKTKPRSGFCIRCGNYLVVNLDRPYCLDCYSKKDAKRNKKERHCHICGEEHATSIRKPLCTSCYAKYKDTFEFATR